MRIILFFLILLISCQVKLSEPKSVSFEVKGIYLGSNDDFFKENSVQRHKGSNSILTILNRTDSIIYIPTDSCMIYMPPVFQGYDESFVDTFPTIYTYKGEMFLESFIKIMPHKSKRITTRITPVRTKKLRLTYAYTTEFKGVYTYWQLVRNKFECDSMYHIKPLIP